MDGRGSKNKGSSYERLVGRTFSMWLTEGERADLFSRNVLSGGAYSRAHKLGRTSGMPGDIIAAHPLALDFVQMFCIEAKHRRDLGFVSFLTDERAKSFLLQVIHEISQQAAPTLQWLVVAKQNRQKSVILMDGTVGKVAVACAVPFLPYHLLFSDTIFMANLDTFLKVVPPVKFMAGTREINHGNPYRGLAPNRRPRRGVPMGRRELPPPVV